MKKKYKAFIIVIVLILITTVVSVVNQNQKSTANIKVNDFYSLASYDCDEKSFDKFRKDSYNWYKSIEKEDGVYLINTAHYAKKVLKIWEKEEVYNSVPKNAFWYFAASPSYLNTIGINIEEAYLKQAENGVRLYMIPDTFSKEEMEAMTDFLKEDALKSVEQSSIKTAFTDNQEIKIITYTPKDDYFTWPSEKGQPLTDQAPVIYVCTSENMKYYENESLTATGINSYIKFKNKETMAKYSNDTIIEKYQLNFTSSSDIYNAAHESKMVSSNVKKVFA